MQKMMKETLEAYSEAQVRMTLAGHAEEMALGLRGNDWWDLVQEDIWDSRPARTPTSADSPPCDVIAALDELPFT